MREFIEIMNMSVEEPLIEEETAVDNHIYVSRDNGAYVAEWNDLPSKEELKLLFETILSEDDHCAYRLNNMVFLTKRKALIAINSLAKNHT